MLYTKSIHAPIEEKDGVRISVMSRHTLEDGVTPDPKIDEDSYDEWNQDLAPSDYLVGAYYRKELNWDHYQDLYLRSLRITNKMESVALLAERAMREDITLLCVEDEPGQCHRRLLAEECQSYIPELKVEHR